MLIVFTTDMVGQDGLVAARCWMMIKVPRELAPGLCTGIAYVAHFLAVQAFKCFVAYDDPERGMVYEPKLILLNYLK